MSCIYPTAAAASPTVDSGLLSSLRCGDMLAVRRTNLRAGVKCFGKGLWRRFADSTRRQHTGSIVLSGSQASSSTAEPSSSSLDMDTVREAARRQFSFFDPAMGNPIFLENAGGSQCPLPVAKAVYNYMLGSFVQLGAPYKISEQATQTVEDAHTVMRAYMNAGRSGAIVMGPSTSQLMSTIANSYAGVLQPGDEIVVQEACHESNAGPWVRLAERLHLPLKFWRVSPDSFHSPLQDLDAILSPKTRIVAVTHVSNVLGEVVDLGAVVQLVKSRTRRRARVVADGVAYAPHQAVDVQAWGVDFYAFSTYKVYGPHLAALYGSDEAFAEIQEHGPNHFFIPRTDIPYKFELGSVPHELAAGVCAMPLYLRVLANAGEGDWDNDLYRAGKMKAVTVADDDDDDKSVEGRRVLVEAAFSRMAAMEAPLTDKFLSYLNSKPQVVIVGPVNAGKRVPTFSFVHKSKSAQQVAKEIVARGFAMRHGHMYAYRLLQALSERLGMASLEDGVVRISMVHYNTLQEVDDLITALEDIL